MAGNTKNPEGGWDAYFLNPHVRAEAEERKARGITPADYGKSWRATYWGMLGDPPETEYGDTEAAEMFLSGIERAIDRGGWSPSERVGLYRLRDRWGKRARGEDARYLVVGTRRGGLTTQEKREIRGWRKTGAL